MKKLWNARKDSEGVSPVIATILMVAITVVLAAILMVMVMGMTGGTTVVATIDAENTSATDVAVEFTSIIPATATTSISFTVSINDGDAAAPTTTWPTGVSTVISGTTVSLTVPTMEDGDTIVVNVLVDGSIIATKSFTAAVAQV